MSLPHITTAATPTASTGQVAQPIIAGQKSEIYKQVINYSLLASTDPDNLPSIQEQPDDPTDEPGSVAVTLNTALSFLNNTVNEINHQQPLPTIATVSDTLSIPGSPATASASPSIATTAKPPPASLTAPPTTAPALNTTATSSAIAPASVQALSASTTLLNAAPVTQNPDGSTSVFGTHGNAIENINATGLTVFGEPLTTAVTVPVPLWYAPANETAYFTNILNNPNIFSTVANGIAVFKMYGQMAAFPDATLQAFFAFLAQNNIKLGIEAGPLVAAAGTANAGIESFAGPGDLVAMLNRIKTLGGVLSYIGWDEPLWFGNITTGTYTVSQLATQVALATTAARAIFPNVQIGDIEPVGEPSTSGTALQTWFTDYAQAAGTPFTSFQADIATWTPGWETALASAITVSHTNNMTIGVVINGLDAAATNDAWATQADANAQLILSDPVLRPDFLIVQSWQSYPSEVGNAAIAGTLPSVAADVAASEPAALAIPAVAQYNTAGFLQNVTWTGGSTASQNGSVLEVLSPTGAVVFQTAWSNVQNFAFDPNTGTASMTNDVLTSALGATPVWQTESFSIGLGATGIAVTAPVTSGSSLTLALATSSQTGATGSGITSRTTPTLSGLATDNAVVTLNVDGTSAGTATASSTGTWSFTFATALSIGAHVVQAAVTNSTTGITTQQEYVLTVDTATPTASTLSLADGSDSGYPDDDITDVAQPVLIGVADPGTQISLRIDGKFVSTVETNLTGQWSYDVNTALAVGTHTITATAINAAGTSAAPTTLQVTIDTAATEAATVNYDPLFDTAWYLLNNPAVAASGDNPYNQFNSVGWMTGVSPSPFFSTNYYLNTYPDVLAAHVSPLLHFENDGWEEGRNAAPNENTLALEKSLPNLPAGEDPIIAYIQTFEYTDAIYTAMPNSKLAVTLLHDTGSSSTDDITNNPALAITADPGATITLALGTATPSTFTLGSTGSWSFAYAPATLADGSYTATVTETELGATISSAATLSFTLDRTPPAITTVSATPNGPVTLGIGNVETITLNFSEAVSVAGLPTLTLNDGGVAQYLSGSGTKLLSFSYTVATGQNTTALAVTTVNLPIGAAITDAAGNAANLAGADIALTGPVVIATQLPSAGANVSLASGATITANQPVNSYSVALGGTSAATASTINANSAVLGAQFKVSVTGAGSAATYGTVAATGSNENDGTIVTRKGSGAGTATLAINLSDAPVGGSPVSDATSTVPGVFTNIGTIVDKADTTIDITGSGGSNLINAGNLKSMGMMFLAATVSGAGTITIGNTTGTAGTLEAQAPIGAGQTVLLNDGTLIIDHLASFLATVTNFNAKDSIVLSGLDVTTVSYENGIVSLNGGSADQLHLQPSTGSSMASGSIALGHVDGATILTNAPAEAI